MFGDIALFAAAAMAVFAVLFGTRHIDATEHQDGLMLAIATESIVKLFAFLAVGIFVTFWMFGGPGALLEMAQAHPPTAEIFSRSPPLDTFLATTLLSFIAIIMLPRQFHVAVVENHSETEIKRAAWLFPLYLVLINLFVVPIALAGLLTFPPGTLDSDMYVLALPLQAGSSILTIAAFVGGLSAATAMVIVESVALSIMVSNDIVMPLVLQRREALISGRENVGSLLLIVRRLAIFAIVALAYMYYRSAGEAQLAAIGLLSFAAISQLAPAFFGGLFWRRGTAAGAIAGMCAGILVWGYTLLLPSFADIGFVGGHILKAGPWGLTLLRPQHLFGLDIPPLVHGVLWSLTINILAYVGFSLRRAPSPIERLQANLFVPSELAPIAPSFRLWRSSVTVAELSQTVARYLGEGRTRAAFESFAASNRISLEPNDEADFRLMRYAEHILASAIGAASSRLVLSLLLRKRTLSTKSALKLLDDANAAIQYNREILQTALDHVRQGIAVFDKEQQLICWNRQFGDILDLPPSLIRVGINLADLLRFNARRSEVRPDRLDEFVRQQLERYLSGGEPFRERFAEPGVAIEVRANRMPDGGIVTTFTDISASVEAAEALERANESLERRVHERTEELTKLNAALARAKGEADAANISKTKFLAAASHDILQPLNAARLYVTSLIERQRGTNDRPLIDNIDASLEAVEEIFGALLDISRLDTGVLRPEFASFRIDELMRQIAVEFAPLAVSKRLQLTYVPCSLVVRSDRRLLRRLIQNLVSNAIKYTPQGRVLVGCRRRGDRFAHRCLRHRPRHSAEQAARHLHGVSPARPGRARRARAGAGAVDRGARRARARRHGGAQFGARAGLAFRGQRAAVERGAGHAASARRTQSRSRPARRHHGAVHRQRAGGARRHGDAAARLGLRGDHRARPRRRAGDDRDGTGDAERPAGRLSSRPRQRHRGDHGATADLRRAAGDPDHRRPFAGGARGSARAEHRGAAQAGEAGGAARDAGAMARAAGGGGGVDAQ